MAKRIKASKFDCQITSLPQTRKDVFIDVLKMHWRSFLGIGLLFLLFTLPFHILGIRDDFIQASLMHNFEAMSADEQQTAILQMLSLKNASALINVISFLILGVFLSGMLRIIRQYSWEENVFFGFDVIKGIKQNIKQMLPLSLLAGVSNALIVYAVNLVSVTTNAALSLVLTMAVCAVCIIGIPTAAYTVVSVSLYDHTLIGHIKLGAVMASKAPVKTSIALVLCFLPFSLCLIPNIYCHIIGRVVGAFCSPIVMLGWYLFALDRFDEVVNKSKFPELVGRGTFSSEKI